MHKLEELVCERSKETVWQSEKYNGRTKVLDEKVVSGGGVNQVFILKLPCQKYLEKEAQKEVLRRCRLQQEHDDKQRKVRNKLINNR